MSRKKKVIEAVVEQVETEKIPHISPPINRKPKNGMRGGRLGASEKQFITENAKSMTDEEMAKKLNRRVETIKPFREKIYNTTPVTQTAVETLRTMPYYREIELQFNKREIEQFEAYWSEFYIQFGADIEFSESIQLVQLIKVNLLIERNLVERNKSKKEVEKVAEKLEAFEKENKDKLDDPSEGAIAMQRQNLQMQVKFSEASYTSRTAEFKILSDKQDSYMRELKATRAVRIDQIKNRKKDFVQLIKDMRDERLRAAEGRELALFNAAATLEKDRLSDIHIFANGEGDRPLLNCDTVILDETNIEEINDEL